MLTKLLVVSANFSPSDAALLGSEFPTVNIESGERNAWPPHLKASDWSSPSFDSWAFDAALDELAPDAFTLVIENDRSDSPFALQVLTRCQRLIGRRNAAAAGTRFDAVLAMHRSLHDLTRPLVRADFNHALDVWQWMLRLDPGAGEAAQLAALFHDVERLLSEADVRVEHLAPDYQKFKDAHASRGAALAAGLLRSAGVAEETVHRSVALIEEHERPSAGREPALLSDADALSFFSFNSSGYADYFGADQTRKKIAYTWRRLRPAARAKLVTVHLRADVASMLRDVAGDDAIAC